MPSAYLSFRGSHTKFLLSPVSRRIAMIRQAPFQARSARAMTFIIVFTSIVGRDKEDVEYFSFSSPWMPSSTRHHLAVSLHGTPRTRSVLSFPQCHCICRWIMKTYARPPIAHYFAGHTIEELAHDAIGQSDSSLFFIRRYIEHIFQHIVLLPHSILYCYIGILIA